jgi:hypothetical protein
MYRSRDMWEDAHRVSKQFGGPVAAQQVGFLEGGVAGSTRVYLRIVLFINWDNLF